MVQDGEVPRSGFDYIAGMAFGITTALGDPRAALAECLPRRRADNAVYGQTIGALERTNG